MSDYNGPWVWRRDTTQTVIGKYGRPWSVVLHYEVGYYLTLDFSAPRVGDCRISLASRRWREVQRVYDFPGHRSQRAIQWRRTTWAEWAEYEKRAADLNARMQRRRTR